MIRPAKNIIMAPMMMMIPMLSAQITEPIFNPDGIISDDVDILVPYDTAPEYPNPYGILALADNNIGSASINAVFEGSVKIKSDTQSIYSRGISARNLKGSEGWSMRFLSSVDIDMTFGVGIEAQKNSDNGSVTLDFDSSVTISGSMARDSDDPPYNEFGGVVSTYNGIINLNGDLVVNALWKTTSDVSIGVRAENGGTVNIFKNAEISAQTGLTTIGGNIFISGDLKMDTERGVWALGGETRATGNNQKIDITGDIFAINGGAVDFSEVKTLKLTGITSIMMQSVGAPDYNSSISLNFEGRASFWDVRDEYDFLGWYDAGQKFSSLTDLRMADGAILYLYYDASTDMLEMNINVLTLSIEAGTILNVDMGGAILQEGDRFQVFKFDDYGTGFTSDWFIDEEGTLVHLLNMGGPALEDDFYYKAILEEDGWVTYLGIRLIPEPSSVLLGLFGLAGFCLRRRR